MPQTSSPTSRVPGKGPKVPGYTIKDVLGQGSMGTVFRATQDDMERDVALKILPAKLANDPTYVQRFIREARATAKVNHPHIVQGYDVGQVNGIVYFAMELVDGESLLARLQRSGTLKWRDAVKLSIQMCKALQAAHEAGLVHRDVKPDNILCTTAGDAKLVDLGLVKRMDEDDGSVTQAGQAVGTPNYIAPEQARGLDTDIRADLYSLGATLYHLIVGRTLFPHRAANAAMTAHVLDMAPNPLKEKTDIPEPLIRVMVKALAKDPKDRYSTPKAMGEELQAVLDGEAIPLAVSFKGKSSLEAPKPLSRSKLPAVAGRKSSAVYKAVSAKKVAPAKSNKEREVFFKEKQKADESPLPTPSKATTPDRPVKPALADLEEMPETETRIAKRRRVKAQDNSAMIGIVVAGGVVLIVLLVFLSNRGPSTPPPKKTVVEYIPDPTADMVTTVKPVKDNKPVLDKRATEASEALLKALTYNAKAAAPEPLERIKRLWDIRDTVMNTSSEKKWDESLEAARKAFQVQLAKLKTYAALEAMKDQCVLDPAREEYDSARLTFERTAMEREWKPAQRDAQLKADQGDYETAIEYLMKLTKHPVPAVVENANREIAKLRGLMKKSEEAANKEKVEAKDTIGRARFELYRAMLPAVDELDFSKAKNLMMAAKAKPEMKPMTDEFTQIATDLEWMEKLSLKAAATMAEKKLTVDYVMGVNKKKLKGVVQNWKDGRLEILEIPPPPPPGQAPAKGAVFQITPEKVHLRSMLNALGWSFEGEVPDDQALDIARYIFWRNRLDPALSKLPKTETPAVAALREKIELVINGTNRFYPPETPRDLTAVVPDDFVQLDGKVKGEHTDATVELSWKITGQNTRKFKLERKKGEEDYEVVKELEKAETTYKDEALPLATKLTYRVTALNDAGESKPSAETTITTPEKK